MDAAQSQLDEIGKFFARIYDSAIGPVVNSWHFASLNAHSREIYYSATLEATVVALHETLVALGESEARGGSVRLVVQGNAVDPACDITSLSKGDLEGELFGPDGWLAKFATQYVPDKYVK